MARQRLADALVLLVARAHLGAVRLAVAAVPPPCRMLSVPHPGPPPLPRFGSRMLSVARWSIKVLVLAAGHHGPQKGSAGRGSLVTVLAKMATDCVHLRPSRVSDLTYTWKSTWSRKMLCLNNFIKL